jgi:hypothetical protein
MPGLRFHLRDLAVFLAAGVIIVSLLAASISLPYLLMNLKLPLEPSQQEEVDRARAAAAEVAIQAVERAQHHMGVGRSDTDLYSDVGVRIMQLYRQRIDDALFCVEMSVGPVHLNNSCPTRGFR